MGISGELLILPIFDISFLVGRTTLEVSVSVFLCPINERAEAGCTQDQCFQKTLREREDSSGLAFELPSLAANTEAVHYCWQWSLNSQKQNNN